MIVLDFYLKFILKLGCAVGLHWSGTIDGGGMGDAMRCDHCGIDKYPETFPGIIVNKRTQ